jgi:hypothetical protein
VDNNTNESTKQRKYRGTEPSDFYLELLLEFAENGSELPITLNIRGLIVSGVLISERKYYESFGGGAVKERLEELKASGKLQILDDVTDEEEELHLIRSLEKCQVLRGWSTRCHSRRRRRVAVARADKLNRWLFRTPTWFRRRGTREGIRRSIISTARMLVKHVFKFRGSLFLHVRKHVAVGVER